MWYELWFAGSKPPSLYATVGMNVSGFVARKMTALVGDKIKFNLRYFEDVF